MSESILEKNLLRKDTSVLDLEGADCNGVLGGFIDLSTGSGAKILVFDSYDRGIEANLRGANLSEAILSSGNATMEQLAQAESLQGATMPDGAKHPQSVSLETYDSLNTFTPKSNSIYETSTT